MKKLEITFGAMTKPLVDQCRAQELALPAADARELQRDADAITRLGARGMLTEGQVQDARRKLMRKIRQAVEAANG